MCLLGGLHFINYWWSMTHFVPEWRQIWYIIVILIITHKIMSWQPLHLRSKNLENLSFFWSIDPKNWFSIEFWFLLESLWLFCVFIISKLGKILLIDDWAMPDLKKIRIQVCKVSQIRVKCQNCWILTSEMQMLSLSTLWVMIKIKIL